MGKFSYLNAGGAFGGKYPVKVGAFCSFAANIYCYWPLEKIALNAAFFNLNLKSSTPEQIYAAIK